MKNKFAAALAGALLLGISSAAQAAYTITIDEVGADVVLTGSGSLNLSNAPKISSVETVTGSFVSGWYGTVTVGATGAVVDRYNPITAYDPINAGPDMTFYGADYGSGKNVGFVIADSIIYLPSGYVSGTDLGTSTGTFLNKTIAGLNLKTGNYTYDFGSDSFLINIGSSVPEPAAWTMMIAGFGAIGATMRRRAQAGVGFI